MKLCWLLMLTAWTAWPHDLTSRSELRGGVVVIRSTYGSDEPAAFLAVEVRSPGGTIEFQTGRTDIRGVFAFVPDRDGEWAVTLDDETGHKSEVRVTVDAAVPDSGPAGGLGMFQKALVGLAVIFGATGLLYGWRVRRT
jgi:nickel transport protein